MESAPDYILAVESGAEVLASNIGPLLFDIMHLSSVCLVTPGVFGVTKDLVLALVAVAKSNYYVSKKKNKDWLNIYLSMKKLTACWL